MSAAVTEVTGATLVRFGVGMRVPVTTISETAAPAAAAGAEAWVAERPRKAAPQIIEEANRRSRVFMIFKVYILQRSPRKADLPPNKFDPGTSVRPGYAGVTGVSNPGSTTISFQ